MLVESPGRRIHPECQDLADKPKHRILAAPLGRSAETSDALPRGKHAVATVVIECGRVIIQLLTEPGLDRVEEITIEDGRLRAGERPHLHRRARFERFIRGALKLMINPPPSRSRSWLYLPRQGVRDLGR